MLRKAFANIGVAALVVTSVSPAVAQDAHVLGAGYLATARYLAERSTGTVHHETLELISPAGLQTGATPTLNTTGLGTVTPVSGGESCINCSTISTTSLSIAFPQINIFRGGPYTVNMTFQSTVGGACTSFFLLQVQGTTVAGNASQIPDCGTNNIWLTEFSGNQLNPALPGGRYTLITGVTNGSLTDYDVTFIVVQ